MNTEPTKKYIFNNIRTLLTEGFETEELRRFCHSTSEFRPVYNQLAPETGKDVIIDKLIIFAEQKLHFEVLLDWAKLNNPKRYELHQPYTQESTEIERKRKQLEIKHTYEKKMLDLKQQLDLTVETAERKQDAILFVNAKLEYEAKADLAEKVRDLDLFYIDKIVQETDEIRKQEFQIEYDFEKKMLVLSHEFKFASDRAARKRDAIKYIDIRRQYDADVDLAKKERDLALSFLKKSNEG